MHLEPGDVLGLKPLVQGDSPTLRTYGKRTDAGDAALFVTVVVQWRMSVRCPCAFDVGNEQEARFIERNQVGTKSLDLFLYAASGNAASA